MTYWRLAAAIAFSSFACAMTVLSILVSAVGPRIAAHIADRAPARRARLLFALCLTPAAGAAALAFGVILPAFLWFEPRDTQETIARTLIVAGTGGILLLTGGLFRGFRDWRATVALAHAWRTRGRAWDRADARMPVFRIDEPFPTVAVLGVQRPSLFLSERVLQACSHAEMTAIIAHEQAHVRVRDNLKRLLLRGSPALPGCRGELDERWAEAAEEAADATAASLSPGLGLDLAQALLRVARLAPTAPRALPGSAFYMGGSIEPRVRRLVEPGPPEAPDGFRVRGCLLAAGALMAASAITAAPAIHRLMEAAVGLLP